LIVTAEISLYPLTTDYEADIIAFIQLLHTQEHIEVFSHSMSTFVRGESAFIFKAINAAFDAIGAQKDTLSLVIKMINRPLPIEKGFLKF
jgi:uncharacterized protein YqgV (UPF0045/DUF77 family)